MKTSSLKYELTIDLSTSRLGGGGGGGGSNAVLLFRGYFALVLCFVFNNVFNGLLQI